MNERAIEIAAEIDRDYLRTLTDDALRAEGIERMRAFEATTPYKRPWEHLKFENYMTDGPLRRVHEETRRRAEGER